MVRAWKNEEGDSLSLHVFLMVPDLAGPLSRIDRIRDGYRKLIAQSGGALVEVATDELDVLPALRTIFKFPQKPHGMSYIGAWTIPRRSFSFVVRVCCAEHGTTGVRDTLVAHKLDLPKSKDWFRDPYDSRFRAPVLRNRSDDSEWDGLFPQHPLSRVRASLRSVKDSINIAEEVRRSEPFVGPQEQSPRKSRFGWLRSR
jgi:hypothetical protein